MRYAFRRKLLVSTFKGKLLWNGERREIQHIPTGHGGELQEFVQQAFIEFLLCKNFSTEG